MNRPIRRSYRLLPGLVAAACLAAGAAAQSPFPTTLTFDSDPDGFVPTNAVHPYFAPGYPGVMPGVVNDMDDSRNTWDGLIEEIPSGFGGVASNGGAGLAVVYPGPNDTYGSGYKNGPFSRVGRSTAFPGAGNQWAISVDVFAMPTASVGELWWTNAASDNSGAGYLTETGFQITPGPSTWNFTTTAGGNPSINLPVGAWYRMEVVYDRSQPNVRAFHRIYNASGTMLLYQYLMTSVFLNPPSSSLGGPRYSWFSVWNNNAVDRLYIDNLRAGPPTTAGFALSLNSNASCYAVGNTVIVNVDVTGLPVAAAGGQFFINFDNTKLTFVSAVPGDPGTGGPPTNPLNPFDVEVYECDGETILGVCVPAPNRLDYAVGVAGGGPGSGSIANNTMAVLRFTAAAGVCNTANLVRFRDNVSGPLLPPTRLTDEFGAAIYPPLFDLNPISIDNTPPIMSCPSNVSVGCGLSTDPPATGTPSATDNCTAPASIVFTYSDSRNLTGCNASGTITRTWTATDSCGNSANCVQTITVVDTTPPVLTACPANINVNAEAGGCSATVTYTAPTATDSCYFEGFEDPSYVSGAYGTTPSVNWNDYSSHLARVPSGTDGVPSMSGGAHGRVNSTSLPPSPDDFTGIFSRLRGYSPVFGSGFRTSVDVYLDLSNPAVLANTYGWDVSTAVSDQANNHRRDFVFHTAGSPGQILVGGSNNSNFTRRNDLASINHYTVTSTGWYTFEWVFRNNGSGVLAVDLNLRDAGGTLLWTETRSDPSDLISTVIGGNRYMWFTFLEVNNLHIDNTRLIRNVPVTCTLPSGSSFTGSNIVTCSATDACLNTASCNFQVNVSAYNELLLTLQLQPNIAPLGNLTRCIRLELWSCPGPAVIVDVPITFTVSPNSPDPNIALASATSVLVPCGNYTCITARDRLHTLRRTASFADGDFLISGTQYMATFTGDPYSGPPGGDWLIGGNLNDDQYIDVLDFGTFVSQFGGPGYGTGNTTCSTPYPHADVSGDGLVTTSDFLFIQINFLKFHEANCCGAALRMAAGGGAAPGDGSDGGPVTRISVKDLIRRGMKDLTVADLNNDGWLDTADAQQFMAGGGAATGNHR